MRISIIIPTLNEAARIAGQVARCRALSPPAEVIVADGGSDDDTVDRAGAAGARVLRCRRRGRSFQMNAGATAASGDVLLFLHADLDLPPPAYESLRSALQDPDLAGGAFRRDFDTPSRLLALGAWLAMLRGRLFGIFLGDQGIFVRRSVFRELGGYPELPLFEDFAFSRRLARWGRVRLLPARIVASGRRFERQGALRGLAGNVLLTLLYMAGVDPGRLARLYERPEIHAPGGPMAARTTGPLRGRP